MGNLLDSHSYDVSEELFYKCLECKTAQPCSEDRFTIHHGLIWGDVCSENCLKDWQGKHRPDGSCCDKRSGLYEKFISC